MDISYFNSGTDAFGSDMTLGTLYDWCLNMGASPLTYYINGVSQGTVTYTTDTQAGATETLCTIGQDGDSDQNFEGYIKTIIVASNSLASYVSQLHTYASH
jgi:hypothetical protein